VLINKLQVTLLLYLISAVILRADLPELSSINPIEFDEVSQKLVASNEATFNFKDIRLKADVITYYKNFNLLNARGEINFVSNNHRLLSENFSLDVESNTFSINKIKYGAWPYYITAKSAGGDEEKINFNQGVFYYGDPHPLSPNLKAETVTIVNNDIEKEVIFRDATLRIGKIPVFYLPKIKYDLEKNPYFLDTRIGYEEEYGAYLQTLSLFPIYDWLRIGLNLDYYSDRGTLYGPAIQYHKQGNNSWFSGAISAGYIDDKGLTGVDIANQPIDKKRYFILAQHKQINDDKLFITFQTNDLSDSEVTRDFKEPIYYDNQFPLNFFETAYLTNNYGLSAFAHFENDDFSVTRERLPEVNFHYFPNQISGSSVFHSLNIRYSEIGEPSIYSPITTPINDSEYTVLDVHYGIYDTDNYKKWLKISPKAEYRGFEYSSNLSTQDPALDQVEQRYDFVLYGLDISSRYQAIYPTNNQLWGIKGLRHIFEPSIGFTRIQSLDSDRLKGYTSSQLSTSFPFSKPATSLIDYRNLDQINDLSLTRLSLKNYFQTKRDSYGSKNIMELHLTADFYHKYEKQNLKDRVSGRNALWLEFNVNPAPWLKFEMASRLKSHSYDLIENYNRLVLTSSLFWELAISSYFKEKFANQVSLDFLYKFNDNTHFSTNIWADLRNNKISRFKLGIDKISNTNWMTSYSINYRKDQRRGDDLSFDIGLKLISY